jgi:outer membrane lipoprotein SlyB
MLVLLSHPFRNFLMHPVQLSGTQSPSPRYLLVGCVLLCLSSCSSNPGYGVQQSVRAQQQIGTVASIQIVPQSSMNGTGGALLGAVLGGVVGHQFGGGSGRTLATGAGVIGGAVAGNQIYRVLVRLDNSRTQQFDYQQIGDLRVGDRVSIEGNQIMQLP